MTGREFAAFRTRMGWSKAEAAKQLGCGRNQVATYEAADEVPLTLALACAARAHGLPPLGAAPVTGAQTIV